MGLLSKVIAMTDIDETGEVLIEDEIKLPCTHDSSDRESIIKDFFDVSAILNCCIFHTSTDEEIFHQLLQAVEGFGKLLPLREHACILLFPSSVDHELLLHHLDKRFHLNVVMQFSADTPQKVLECIQKYI
jgi:hypothetical protein